MRKMGENIYLIWLLTHFTFSCVFFCAVIFQFQLESDGLQQLGKSDAGVFSNLYSVDVPSFGLDSIWNQGICGDDVNGTYSHIARRILGPEFPVP
ncbi:hypothetical protein MPTK1_5g22595 [Marchantia polymorpha subsp. ruderalis]